MKDINTLKGAYKYIAKAKRRGDFCFAQSGDRLIVAVQTKEGEVFAWECLVRSEKYGYALEDK